MTSTRTSAKFDDDLIADTGLAFTYDPHIECGDCLLLRWSMLAPSAASSRSCPSA